MPVTPEFGKLVERFGRQLEPDLVPTKLKSSRFTYRATPERLVIFVPPADQNPDWALVYGLAERHGRHLTLVLPSDSFFATAQRIPWLTDDARPDLWLYEGLDLHRHRPASRDQTIDAVRRWANKKGGPAAELEKASQPLHLRDRKAAVQELADWATRHPQLDAAHRQGQRSWQAAGQRVLTFVTTNGGGLRITAGIQDKAGQFSRTLTLAKGASLSASQVQELQALVVAAISVRLDPGGPYRADEHWLQAALRRDPSMVGVESPALREVPAWRPGGLINTFSRGYLDLLGLDGQGDVRIVEAKIAKSKDEMTLFQGVDYVVWAQAYESAIKAKLSAPKSAKFHLHFVVGSMATTSELLPKRVAAYADALDTRDSRIRFHFHVVHGWQEWTPDPLTTLRSEPWSKNTLPA